MGLGPQQLALKPGLTACWAEPLQPQQDWQQQSSLLWLLGSYMAPAATGSLPVAAALSGASPAAAAAAAGQQQLSWHDHVFLWGIDGLGGVVLSGIAQNAIMSNKMSQPRAHLWGRSCSGDVTWQRPQLLLQQAAAAAAGGCGQQQVACRSTPAAGPAARAGWGVAGALGFCGAARFPAGFRSLGHRKPCWTAGVGAAAVPGSQAAAGSRWQAGRGMGAAAAAAAAAGRGCWWLLCQRGSEVPGHTLDRH